jgi:hydrogenase maturation protein HypF
MTQQRLCMTIQGAVQGVGFRPFVYRLATSLQLCGWVKNTAQGVEIEAEGDLELLARFQMELREHPPPRAVVETIESTYCQLIGHTSFEIQDSAGGPKTAFLLPDLATCPDCLRESFDPCDRRYHYPFTNCTNCGPRYSIIQSLPYDRQNTTMQNFEMCPDCRAEYENPRSRRFHTQPNACPVCGPQVELWDRNGNVVSPQEEARDGKHKDRYRPIRLAAAGIQQGKIVAVKGLGGFHLIVDARNSAAVAILRDRKQRPDKPLALMYPCLAQVKQECEVSTIEAELLQSHTAPIVLLKRRQQEITFHSSRISDAVAPNFPYLGIMLPYTPLHHLLIAELNLPVVATSGNLNGAPICYDEHKALNELCGLADFFLVHNRPIQHPIDDSIVQVINDQPQLLRRARGYAPLPIVSSFPQTNTASGPQKSKPLNILAVGAQLKNTIALAKGDRIFLGPHLGDLQTASTLDRFRQTIHEFLQIYECQPDVVACDAHPDYLSTQVAHYLGQKFQVPVVPVQHHYAHILSCMAEHWLEPPALGIAWDGTGYGLDHTLWGGEFLQITSSGFKRVGYFQPFILPGGEKAIREPWRTAVGLLHTCFSGIDDEEVKCLLQSYAPQDLRVLRTMLEQTINTPQTSSVGRLFDGVASLTNKVQLSSFEGQAAMMLEFALPNGKTEEYYPFNITPEQPFVVNWQPVIKDIVTDIIRDHDFKLISAKFHNTMTEISRCSLGWLLSKSILRPTHHRALTGREFSAILE